MLHGELQYSDFVTSSISPVKSESFALYQTGTELMEPHHSIPFERIRKSILQYAVNLRKIADREWPLDIKAVHMLVKPHQTVF